jgi:hypothetical protein
MSFSSSSYPSSHPDPTVRHLLVGSGTEQLQLSRQAARRFEQTQALLGLPEPSRPRPAAVSVLQGARRLVRRLRPA